MSWLSWLERNPVTGVLTYVGIVIAFQGFWQ